MFTCLSYERQNVAEKMEIIAGELPSYKHHEGYLKIYKTSHSVIIISYQHDYQTTTVLSPHKNSNNRQEQPGQQEQWSGNWRRSVPHLHQVHHQLHPKVRLPQIRQPGLQPGKYLSEECVLSIKESYSKGEKAKIVTNAYGKGWEPLGAYKLIAGRDMMCISSWTLNFDDFPF